MKEFRVALQDSDCHSRDLKTHLKPANSKVRKLLKKLQALAERGIDGEKASAQRKIARLKARFDFSSPDPAETPDLFAGTFKRSSAGRPIYSFEPNQWDVANAVKWAIESATKIPCRYRHRDLVAEAAAPTAKKLRQIANHIASSFHALLEKFSKAEAVSAADRGVFVMGLYDGMMNEARKPGQSLPNRPCPPKRQRARKRASVCGADLHIHPYTLGAGLGRQIRFAAPVEQIVGELEVAMRGSLPRADVEPHQP